jgi:hypothetical protein
MYHQQNVKEFQQRNTRPLRKIPVAYPTRFNTVVEFSHPHRCKLRTRCIAKGSERAEVHIHIYTPNQHASIYVVSAEGGPVRQIISDQHGSSQRPSRTAEAAFCMDLGRFCSHLVRGARTLVLARSPGISSRSKRYSPNEGSGRRGGAELLPRRQSRGILVEVC